MTVHTYVNVSVLRLVCAGPSARHAFTANDRGHVRIITLRLCPAAAAEWAKPREIRRGNSPWHPQERACRLAWQNPFSTVNTVTARGVYRGLPTRISNHSVFLD